MELDHTDDVAILNQKLTAAGNEVLRLQKLLESSGDLLTEAKVEVNNAEGVEQKKKRKEILIRAEGAFAKIKSQQKLQKEIIAIVKHQLKGEGSHY